MGAVLHDEWDEHDEENSDYESDDDSADDWGYGYNDRYYTRYECVKCEIKHFQLYTDLCWGWPDGSYLDTDDLKDLIVIERPKITFVDGKKYEAPNGRWFTVGDLFDTIAENEASYREGPDSHVYFEGFCQDRRGRFGVIFWGS